MSPDGKEAEKARKSGAGSVEDDALMQAIAMGDASAAKKVVADNLPSILSLARYMLGSTEDAEDVAQEGFVRLWAVAENWQPRRALIKTWLRRVVGNLCIDHLRRHKTLPLAPGFEPPVAATQHLKMEEDELKRRVRLALQQLPERQKLALTLCHFEGLGQKQAARVMQISEHALESLLARGRRSLKKQLRGEWAQLLPDRVEVEALDKNDVNQRVKK